MCPRIPGFPVITKGHCAPTCTHIITSSEPSLGSFRFGRELTIPPRRHLQEEGASLLVPFPNHARAWELFRNMIVQLEVFTERAEVVTLRAIVASQESFDHAVRST